MEELLELRTLVQNKDYNAALLLIDEMEEMSREDKINKIYSYVTILLLHLIKQKAENRTTRSWALSIKEAQKQIKRTNKRHKSGGYYAGRDELAETIADAWSIAVDRAALEAFEGVYDSAELSAMVDRTAIETEALTLIWQEA